jgi:hypothetical protein
MKTEKLLLSGPCYLAAAYQGRSCYYIWVSISVFTSFFKYKKTLPTCLNVDKGIIPKRYALYKRTSYLYRSSFSSAGRCCCTISRLVFRRELLALSSCLHDSAAATRIPVVASPTDGYDNHNQNYYIYLTFFCQFFL